MTTTHQRRATAKAIDAEASAAPADVQRTRPTRADAELGQRRRRTEHFDGSFDRQLPVDESRLDNENFTYRWFNDAKGRVSKYTKFDDWDPVTEEEVGGAVEHSHVGYGRDGSPIRAVLMKKPRKWHEKDQARKIALSREEEAEMMRRAPSGERDEGLGAESYAFDGNGVRAGTSRLPGREVPLADDEA